MADRRPTRVLVIDDSAYNRRALAGFLESEEDLTVVGKACDGEEGLQLALKEHPDVITLDLEMPRMDGFSFLRILMAKRPTPVIVISSHADQDNVFRALELGALDFVAKPTHRISPEIREIREQVVEKVRLARMLRKDSLHPPAPASTLEELERAQPAREKPRRSAIGDPGRIVALAASTGGPAALTSILRTLPASLDAAIIVVQHMPPRFTTTFAERLDRICEIPVKEIKAAELLLRGTAYVAAGEASAEIIRTKAGLCIVPAEAGPNDRYVPSADRLFSSMARACGESSLAFVLTGMGDDGARGAEELKAAGGTVIAESEASAVVFGMPAAAIATGATERSVLLDRIPAIIEEFAEGTR
jgi:two-component system chemotaxis response regulator CheB